MTTPVPLFADGNVLLASQLNALRSAVAEIAGTVDAPRFAFRKVIQESTGTLRFGLVRQARYLLLRFDTVGGDADSIVVKVNGATVFSDGDPGGAIGVAVDLDALGGAPAYNTLYEVTCELGLGGGNPATAIILYYVCESDTSGQLL